MRLIIFLLLIATGTLIGISYAVVHDLITYQMSPEFYSQVRFKEYYFSNSPTNAAMVGLRVTWLYSLILSFIITLTGALHSENKIFVKRTVQAFAVTLSTSLLFAIFARYSSPTAWGTLADEKILSNVSNPEMFLTVQKIHNFSYMGGIAGMLLSILFLIYWLRKRKK